MEAEHQTAELVLTNQVPIIKVMEDKTRNDALREVWFYMEHYWKLKDETPEYFLLTRTNVTLNGHLIIAFLFGWWMLFIPNLAYHIAMQKKMKIFK